MGLPALSRHTFIRVAGLVGLTLTVPRLYRVLPVSAFEPYAPYVGGSWNVHFIAEDDYRILAHFYS